MGKYSMIFCYDFLNDVTLNLNHVSIISIVYSFEENKKECYMTNNTFAEYLHISYVPNISKYINHLIKNDYLLSFVNKEIGNLRKLYLTEKSKNIIKNSISKNANSISKNANTLLAKKLIPISENTNTLLAKKLTNINNEIEKEKENVYMGSTSEQAPSPNIYIDVLSSSMLDEFRIQGQKDEYGYDVFKYPELNEKYPLEQINKNATISEAKASRVLCMGLLERICKKYNQTNEELINTLQLFNSFHLNKNTFKDNMKVKTLLSIVNGYVQNPRFIRN